MDIQEQGSWYVLWPCMFLVEVNLASGMISAAASLGLCLLWDTELGLSQVDKYTYSSEEYIKVRFVHCASLVGELSFRLRPVHYLLPGSSIRMCGRKLTQP